MPKKLVITADDYGLSEAVNRRIIECYAEGAVTDVSLMAVGDSFGHAVELAKRKNLNKIGMHLALTGRFKPASPPGDASTLITQSGRFAKSYRSFLIRYFLGIAKKDEIYTELRNQILRVRNEGFKITHLDSHEHVHMAPGILKIVIKLAKEEGIEYVRFPLEKIRLFAKPSFVVRNILLSFMCGISEKIIRGAKMRYNDNFIGHARALKLKKEDLISAISGLKDGLTELSCHPGSREEEAKVLCDTGFIDELRKRSVQLVSY
jgi:predicted glycoside hydrolase/deacetylase ChbG (UPF0249 family)